MTLNNCGGGVGQNAGLYWRTCTWDPTITFHSTISDIFSIYQFNTTPNFNIRFLILKFQELTFVWTGIIKRLAAKRIKRSVLKKGLYLYKS